MEAFVVTTRRKITMMEALVIVEVQKNILILWTQRFTKGSLFFERRQLMNMKSVFL